MLGRIIAHAYLPPEIKRLSRASYDDLYWQAKFRRGDAAWVVPLGVGVAAAIVWLFAAGLMRSLVFAAANGGPVPGPIGSTASWYGLNIVVGGVLALAIAAFIRHAMLMRSIRLLMNRCACPFCEFSLFGLRVSPQNSVVCPECGEEVFLHEHRMHRDDIEVAPAFSGAGPRGAYRDADEPERDRSRRGRRFAAK